MSGHDILALITRQLRASTNPAVRNQRYRISGVFYTVKDEGDTLSILVSPNHVWEDAVCAILHHHKRLTAVLNGKAVWVEKDSNVLHLSQFVKPEVGTKRKYRSVAVPIITLVAGALAWHLCNRR